MNLILAIGSQLARELLFVDIVPSISSNLTIRALQRGNKVVTRANHFGPVAIPIGSGNAVWRLGCDDCCACG